jgi:hypothetical protein
MSKWCSALSKATFCVAVASAALAGCNRDSQKAHAPSVHSSTVVEPETLGIDAVAQEEPAVARTRWNAVNDAARDVAGNLHVSLESVRGGPVIFAFANGITISAQPIAVAPADSRSGIGAQSFAAVLGGDPRVDAHLYRVESEVVTASARAGGLCGHEPTKHMAVSEFVDSTGNWVFKIAAFKGASAPGSVDGDLTLCGAFSFAAPA